MILPLKHLCRSYQADFYFNDRLSNGILQATSGNPATARKVRKNDAKVSDGPQVYETNLRTVDSYCADLYNCCLIQRNNYDQTTIMKKPNTAAERHRDSEDINTENQVIFGLQREMSVQMKVYPCTPVSSWVRCRRLY